MKDKSNLRNYIDKRPLFLDKEWHLIDLNVKYAWKQNITGKGINVCIIDTGIYENPDLFIEKSEYNPIINNIEVIIKGLDYTHGTAIAGIIGAKGNKYCIGIAPKCILHSYNHLGLYSKSNNTKLSKFIMDNKNKIDIYNNSWGPIDETEPNTQDSKQILEVIKQSCKKGRNKKGNIFVFAAGNNNLSGGLATYNDYANSRFTITVGAINEDLNSSTYSDIGSSILCVAPGGRDVHRINKTERTRVFAGPDTMGITTTLPYNDKTKGLIPYTHIMNGTSAATPMVTGCIALMLNVRPDLTWRDVKEIISRSCYQNYFHNDTVINQNIIINGDNRIISQEMGFGIIHIKRMIRNAKNWKLLPKEKKIKNKISKLNVVLNKNNKKYETQVVIDKNITIETVQLYVSMNINKPEYQNISNIQISIVSPHGTNIIIANQQTAYVDKTGNVTQYYNKYPILCEYYRGEKSKGTWKFIFEWFDNPDNENDDKSVAILNKLKLDVRGHK